MEKNALIDAYTIKEILPDVLCEHIIELFEEDVECENRNNPVFIIPKKNKRWEKIERIIYKELLVNLNRFKNDLMNNIRCDDDIEFIYKLNDNLFLKEFKIEKMSNENMLKKTNNRYNVLSFIFFLNELPQKFKSGLSLDIENNTIMVYKQGDLVFLREHVFSNKNVRLIENQYVISGQLCSKNVV
jgi:hypothetical protein